MRPELLRLPGTSITSVQLISVRAVVPGHWLFGTTHQLRFPASVEQMTKFMNERIAEHGTVHIITILWMQQVRILSPDALKVIAQSNVNIRKCTSL